MQVINQVLLIAFLLFFPQLAIRIGKKVNWLSPILSCYAAGIIIGNVFPAYLDSTILEKTIEGTVALAIPLLLFGSNVKSWLSQPGKSLLAFGLSMIATTIAAFLGYLFFSDSITNADEVAAMLAGVYSGGTINMSAITLALDFKQELFLLLNGYDIIFSSIYFLFIISVAQPLLKRFLTSPTQLAPTQPEHLFDHRSKFHQFALPQKAKWVGMGVALAVLVALICVGLSLAIFSQLNSMFVIVGISVLGVAASFFPKVRSLPGTFETGDYLLLMFALSIGANANFDEMLQSSGETLPLAFFIFITAVSLHLLLCKIFKVDVITFLITSTAAVYGPPFIGPVATALKKKDWILPGLTVAILGNAVGTYLGILLYQLISYWG